MPSDPALKLQQGHHEGDVIGGRYVLRKKLGEGGMGVVWVAHSNALDVDVALKMLRRELAGTPAVERMAREARTAAQLGHPAMVRVFDFGISEEQEPFVAMELLQGEELYDRLQREKRLPAVTAVAMMLPIIDGLGTAHDMGIVHRDIKPENIFITADQQNRVQPKVLDFGIAKLGHEQASLRLTQAGTVMGSPSYLSPEQAAGLEDIDYRCDIWAVGVVLYELVTGVAPFHGDNYNQLIHSIERDAPLPLSAHAAGDAQLWIIVERCLMKAREQRWGSMWELGEALALWLFERDVRVDAAGRSLKHGWLDGTITGVKILVGSERPDPDSLQPPSDLPRGTPLFVPSARREGDLARTQVRPRHPPRRSPAWPLIFAACAGALLLLAWRRYSPEISARWPRAEIQAAVAVAHPVRPDTNGVLTAEERASPGPDAPHADESLNAPAASTRGSGIAAPAEAASSAETATAPNTSAATPTAKRSSHKGKPPVASRSTKSDEDGVPHNTEFGF